MCVHVSVCSDVHVCYWCSITIVCLYAQIKICEALVQCYLGFQLVDFWKEASFRSYSIICLLLQPILLFQPPSAHF